MRRWQLILMAAAILLGLAACDGICVYTTHIDQVTPEIPGLIVEAHGPTPQGQIIIANETGKDLYILDQDGKESILIAAVGEVFIYRTEKESWESFEKNDGIIYSDPPVFYAGPRPKIPWRTVSTWVVRGRVEDTPFEIHGRTVYTP